MWAQNPIIPGFAPDPAICRRGADFYLTTSSFQWWPGLPIYHSRDLRHWELLTYALTDARQADLRRIGDSAGIWAPSLTYSDGLFWLIFSPASGSRQHGYESPNYLTTAPDIGGPWSNPVFLNESGNDASLFHDEDGRKWVVNTDQRITPGSRGHVGVLLQEYSPREHKLIGPVKDVFAGTSLGIPEGSKLYKHGGWYYLMIAEGGTEYGHAVTMARSRSIWGPYEVHPENPILTARGDPSNPIQRAGHADMVTLKGDRVAVVYLASRPVDHRSMLGRETFLAGARWSPDGWLRLDQSAPTLSLPDFNLPDSPLTLPPGRDDFNQRHLNPEWNSLRQPMDKFQDLRTRPGWLILTPTPSFLSSIERPNILARRVRHHIFSAETALDFRPTGLEQWAGLVCYYDTRHWYFLNRLLDEHEGRSVAVYTKGPSGTVKQLAIAKVKNAALIRLGVDCDGRHIQFRFGEGASGPWTNVGPPEDALILSDEFVESVDPVRTFGSPERWSASPVSIATAPGRNPRSIGSITVANPDCLRPAPAAN